MPYACGYCGSAMEVAGEVVHEPDCSAPCPAGDEDAPNGYVRLEPTWNTDPDDATLED